MEKAFTTPEQYPLTLKATTTACNQKSNRDPQVSYSEDQVQDALDELREDLLVAEVFTGGGRAPRYRHYMRQKFDFSEGQFAIIAELLLRGRQQPGELRTRASRMVRIESQDQLRNELNGLMQKGYLQANGPLERRGIEVDHTFYLPKEGKTMSAGPQTPSTQQVASGSSDESKVAADSASLSANSQTAEPNSSHSSRDTELETLVREQADRIDQLQAAFDELNTRFERIERDLGL